MDKLYIIIPCYNEEEVLPVTAPMFLDKIKSLISQGKISEESRIMFVDDGSKDSTWEIICDLAVQDDHFTGIQQSRNRGHQNAVLAGLMEAKDLCDITISIDCDGQDDINAMDKMVDAYHEGCDVVYGVRNSRATDSFMKRNTARAFYRFMNRMGAEVVYDHADYRLISARAVRELAEFKEVNLFLRGMVPLVGFKSTSVYYDRSERIAGKSHYPMGKMVALALNGITSLSVKPIRIVFILGVVISLLSLIGILYAVISYFAGASVSGWASLMAVVTFLGGAQILSIGIIGEYVGKTYMESKHRPRYIISDRTTGKKK